VLDLRPVALWRLLENLVVLDAHAVALRHLYAALVVLNFRAALRRLLEARVVLGVRAVAVRRLHATLVVLDVCAVAHRCLHPPLAAWCAKLAEPGLISKALDTPRRDVSFLANDPLASSLGECAAQRVRVTLEVHVRLPVQYQRLFESMQAVGNVAVPVLRGRVRHEPPQGDSNRRCDMARVSALDRHAKEELRSPPTPIPGAGCTSLRCWRPFPT